MLRLLKSIGLLFLVIFSACSQRPKVTSEATPSTPLVPTTLLPSTATQTVVPTPFHGGTFVLKPEMKIITPTPLPKRTPTATPSQTPSPTLTEAYMPSDFSPILYGKKYDANTFFLWLGGVQGGEWLGPQQAFALFAGPSQYDAYSFTGRGFHIQGHAPQFSMTGQSYFVGTDVTDYEFGMVGVAQGWQVTQKQAEELNPENEFYRQVVTDWLSQAGVVDPQIGTIQVYRVDLEGDGSDEIFINDTRVESQHTAKPGDHCIILMRKVTGSGVVTIPILVDLYAYVNKSPINPFPCTYSIGNFIDLNQDGVLDVVVEYQRWEGFGASVYDVDGQNVKQVLGATCITS